MNFIKTLSLAAFATLLASNVFAQTDDVDTVAAPTTKKCCNKHKSHEMGLNFNTSCCSSPINKWYSTYALDGAILSTAVFDRPGARRELAPVRFSVVNFGRDFNYNFDKNFGIFTGLGIKNIGVIEKLGDSTIKRRVYTIGIPLGFKLGQLEKGHYGFIGGGIDFPLNYREKGYVQRYHKQKFNEWFSERTPHTMPYLFAGITYKSGHTLKLQYYPSNFFNTKFEETTNGVKTNPYSGMNANILYVTFGMSVHYKSGAKCKAKEESEPEEM